MHAKGGFGPHFFKNARGQRVTLNGVRYRAMSNDYFFQIVVANNLEEFWFQQDGAVQFGVDLVTPCLHSKFRKQYIRGHQVHTNQRQLGTNLQKCT